MLIFQRTKSTDHRAQNTTTEQKIGDAQRRTEKTQRKQNIKRETVKTTESLNTRVTQNVAHITQALRGKARLFEYARACTDFLRSRETRAT